MQLLALLYPPGCNGRRAPNIPTLLVVFQACHAAHTGAVCLEGCESCDGDVGPLLPRLLGTTGRTLDGCVWLLVSPYDHTLTCISHPHHMRGGVFCSTEQALENVTSTS